ncbi:hypothetical protein ACTXT7_007867 [Hymenolepis weldensis]
MKFTRFCIVTIFLTLLALSLHAKPLNATDDEEESAIIDRIEQKRGPKAMNVGSRDTLDESEDEKISRRPRRKDDDMNHPEDGKDRRRRPSREDKRWRKYPDEQDSDIDDDDEHPESEFPRKKNGKRLRPVDDEDYPRHGRYRYRRYRPDRYYRRYDYDDDYEDDHWRRRWGRGRRPPFPSRRYRRKKSDEDDDDDDDD